MLSERGGCLRFIRYFETVELWSGDFMQVQPVIAAPKPMVAQSGHVN